MSEHITKNWTVYRNSAYYEILSGGLEVANTCPASCQGDIALGATIAEHIVKCVNGYAKLEQQRNALLDALRFISAGNCATLQGAIIHASQAYAAHSKQTT